MSNEKILIIRHQSMLREVTESEPLTVLTDEESKRSRSEVVVDMREFQQDIEGGHWRTSDTFIREQANKIRQQADSTGVTRLLHFGIVEVPHLIALGAYLEDARPVEVFDYDRVRNNWVWKTKDATLQMTAEGKPHELMPAAGAAVLRVEVTYPIADTDVEAMVGKNMLCDIRVRPIDGTTLQPGLVQSNRDVEAVRTKVREALGAIAEFRPGTQVVHLFVSAPVSVCVAVGQELRLRNTVSFQTYRFRRVEGGLPYKPAILLTHSSSYSSQKALTVEERAEAASLRQILAKGLEDVKNYAEIKHTLGQTDQAWYDQLLPGTALELLAPYPGLSPIWKHVQSTHTLSMEPRREEYEFSKDTQAWKMSDQLVLALSKALGGTASNFEYYQGSSSSTSISMTGSISQSTKLRTSVAFSIVSNGLTTWRMRMR